MPRLRVLLAVPLLTVIAGCYGPSTPGVAISGRVTYQGKPVREAAIFFTPDISKEGKGGQGLVTRGRYSIPSEEGPSPGEMNVIIVDPRRTNPGYKSNWTDPLLPDSYQSFKRMTVTIPARKSFSLDFDLK
jgi:hypothetical protein